MLALAATSGTPRPVALNGAGGVIVTSAGSGVNVRFIDSGTPAALWYEGSGKWSLTPPPVVPHG